MDDDTAELISRVQQLEDREAIRALLQDYRRTLDSKDFVAYSELFTPDGEWQGGLGGAKGPHDIRVMVERAMGAQANQVGAHLVVNPVIDVAGDTATAESTWVFVRPGDAGRPAMAVMGHYRDRLVRLDGVWKFSLRETYVDFPESRHEASVGTRRR